MNIYELVQSKRSDKDLIIYALEKQLKIDKNQLKLRFVPANKKSVTLIRKNAYVRLIKKIKEVVSDE